MKNESRWSLPWAERPPEEARIFNPAFCADLISHTVREYCRMRQTALSMANIFLVLPLILHKPTREVLPRRANTAFAGWVAENSALLAEMPERTKRLRPISREALLFALQHQLLRFESGGFIQGAKLVRIPTTTSEVSAARSAAVLLGRWFAGQSTQSSILQGLGITP